MTYAEYLKTNHWQKMRRAALDLYGGHCSMCFTTHLLNVHHTTYRKNERSIWFQEDVNTDLIVLCQNCHHTMHTAEKLDSERFANATARMTGGNIVAKLPSTSRYIPKKQPKIPDLPSTRRMHTWSAREREAYKALQKKRVQMMIARRGGK